MLRVKLVEFEELTEEEQDIQPENGKGRRLANYVKITDGDETVSILSDAAEPEDANYRRDFGNVIPAIERAYKIGLTRVWQNYPSKSSI